jgi:hypothetical protein
MLMGRFGGFPQVQIARRTVPCYKYVIEPQGEELALCLLVDSKYLYRYPFENLKKNPSLATKARYLRGEMEKLQLREFEPGHCRYVHTAV